MDRSDRRVAIPGFEDGGPRGGTERPDEGISPAGEPAAHDPRRELCKRAARTDRL